MQDTLAHNPDMSDTEKGQIQQKINNLTAEKEVLDWENTKPGKPTAADYEVRENYYQRLWNQNQDDIVNGLGNNTLVQGSDEWYDILKKGDDLLEKRDAYRMGKMGMLDGENTNSAIQTDNGQTGGEEIPQTQDEPKEEDSNLIVDFLNEFPDRVISTISDIREGAVNVVEGGIKWVQENAEAISEAQEKAAAEEQELLEAPLETLGLEDLEKRQELEKDLLEQDFEIKIDEEVKKQIEEKRQECIEAYENMLPMQKEILKSQGVNSVEEYIEFVFTEKNWEERIAKRVNRKFDKLLDKELGLLDDKFAPYYVGLDAVGRIGELDNNPEFSLIDWSKVELIEPIELKDTSESIYYSQGGADLNYIDLELEEKLNADAISFYQRYAINKDIQNLSEKRDELISGNLTLEQILEADLEELDINQLAIRTSFEIQNIEQRTYDDILKDLQELENSVIIESTNIFNNAMQQWMEGDDTEIRKIVMETYCGSKYLEEVDLNEVRKEYVQHRWEMEEYEEDLVATRYEYEDKLIRDTVKELLPYYLMASDFTFEGGNFVLDISPDEAKGYATMVDEISNMMDSSGTALGVMSIPAGFVNMPLGATYAITGLALSLNADVWQGASENIIELADENKSIRLVFNPLLLTLDAKESEE